jgi:hypothetical protein
MILLVPILFLLAGALAIIILDRIRPKYGTSWLIASASSIIAWIVIIYLRLQLPSTLAIRSWESPDLFLQGQFSLLLDYQSWPYALGLTTITLAVILTDAARTRYDSNPKAWSASLVTSALGLLALQSGSSLTLMIILVVLDLFELIYLLLLEKSSPFSLRIILSYAVRTASILMLFFGTIQGWQTTTNLSLDQIPTSAGIFILLSAGMRLGVLPLNLPFLQEPKLSRGTGNIIRLTPIASSLCLLARLPVNLLPDNFSGWMPLFNALLSLAALYAALRWLSAAGEIQGRPFWIVGWASLATAAAINGAPDASLSWGLALLLPGSLLFLYFPRIQRINFLLYLGLFGLIGLPFTPLASGWVGLMANGVTFWTFLYLLSHAILVLGYINKALQPGGEPRVLESWARVVYPLGLIIIIQSILVLNFVGWPGSLTVGRWWLGAISNGLIIAAVFLVRRFGISPPYIQLPTSSAFARISSWILPRLEPVFRLDWLYQGLWHLNNFVGKALRAISIIIEGDGGLLWTILLLILLISLVTTILNGSL